MERDTQSAKRLSTPWENRTDTVEFPVIGEFGDIDNTIVGLDFRNTDPSGSNSRKEGALDVKSGCTACGRCHGCGLKNAEFGERI